MNLRCPHCRHARAFAGFPNCNDMRAYRPHHQMSVVSFAIPFEYTGAGIIDRVEQHEDTEVSGFVDRVNLR